MRQVAAEESEGRAQRELKKPVRGRQRGAPDTRAGKHQPPTVRTDRNLYDSLNGDLHETLLDMIKVGARSPPGHRRFPESYEEKCERRLETHEVLRSRVNVTSCRSMEKASERETEDDRLSLSPRQLEFCKRRHLEEVEEKKPWASSKSHTSPRKEMAMEEIRRRLQCKDAGNIYNQICWNNNHSPEVHPAPASFPLMPALQSCDVPASRGTCKEVVTTKDSQERGSRMSSEINSSRMIIQRDSSQQTDRGTAVLDKELYQLSEYLKEALHREMKLKKKMAALQELLAALIHASEKSWRSQLNEDKLKCKVGTLEEKLQMCNQHYPKNGVKRILLEMEEQKQKYEEHAKESVQKILKEKIIAETQLQMIQMSLNLTEDECFLWKEEYEKLKGEWSELTSKHVELQNEIHILQSKLQWVDSQDMQLQKFQARLKHLEKERADLHSRMNLLAKENNLKSGLLDNLAGRLRSTEEQKLAMESSIHHLESRLTSTEDQKQAMQSRINHLEKELLLAVSQPPTSLSPEPAITTKTLPPKPAVLQKAQMHTRKQQRHRAQAQKMAARLTAEKRKCAELQWELDSTNDDYILCHTKLRECQAQIRTFQAKKYKKGCCHTCLMPFFVLLLAMATALYYITILQYSFV